MHTLHITVYCKGRTQALMQPSTMYYCLVLILLCISVQRHLAQWKNAAQQELTPQIPCTSSHIHVVLRDASLSDDVLDCSGPEETSLTCITSVHCSHDGNACSTMRCESTVEVLASLCCSIHGRAGSTMRCHITIQVLAKRLFKYLQNPLVCRRT